MSRKRLITIVAGAITIAAVVVRVVVAGAGSASGAAVDGTNPSAKPAVSPAASPSASVAARPLLVLNPRSVRRGGSFGVWGSGFANGATLAIYVKQEASENVNPVTVVETDQTGQFTSANVTVPESVASGSLIVQARDTALGTTATAGGTLVDDPVATEASPSATPQPQPEPTEQPIAATQPQATATTKGHSQARATPQPKATEQPQPKPTEQPQPKPTEPPQPKPTQQPKPADSPKPTEQPKPADPPKPTEQPKPADPPKPPDPPKPGDYTVASGDSLSAIAAKVYGDPNAWKAVYDANRDAIGANPNLIQPGTDLVIPPKD